ncbi:microfibril-associated glycoprotein 4-like [Toxorhynchites rutilus septentrionalis]|uniref:microfibril-associated glycoprotein 4-like n=1 Tax=Toxorhynchites rutilus septentrionalis TaxID=329112 RepID=UPI0024792D52|nr:microfibril-associated glycoprotein 4-like [Toxorhynchites rutilus septentrionalis]
MFRLFAVVFVALYCIENVAGAVGQPMEGESEAGLDYQKLLAKLEILDTKITRVETTSRDQFSSLESKLDKIAKEIENISWSVQYAQKDVRVLRGEIQQFKNHSNEQLKSLGGSVTIIQSLLVEGHRQKQVYPVNRESSHQTTAQELRIYDSCDVASRNESKIERVLPEPGFGDSFPVLCDQSYESGGWTVIQNRFNGSVDFYRGWKEYKNGFGNLNGEFWLGLDRLHALTYSAPHELHVLMEDFDNKTVVAKYSRFAVGNEHESYSITRLGNYTGSAGDGLSYHRGSKFSTMDVNHDVPGNNGGVDWTGAWWYRRGHHSNLNGQYLKGAVDHTKYHGKGITWNPFRGDDYSLKRSRMMIKRILN